MALLHSTWLYITLVTIALLHSTWLTWLNIPLPCPYLILLDPPFSTILLALSTWLYISYATMALRHSAWLYILVQLFFYLNLHSSSMVLLHCTWLNITPNWLCFTLSLHNILPWVYFTLLDSTLLYYGSPSLNSTWLYVTLTLLYVFLLESILVYQGSTVEPL